MNGMEGKDFLSIRDFSPSEIQYLLVLGRQIKAHPTAYAGALRRQTLAMIFEKPSLRTRVTFDVGIQQLGGFSIYLSPAEINLGKRESVYDVAKNLERMVQGIMIRTFAHEMVVQMAGTPTFPSSMGLPTTVIPARQWRITSLFGKLKAIWRKPEDCIMGDGDNVARSLFLPGRNWARMCGWLRPRDTKWTRSPCSGLASAAPRLVALAPSLTILKKRPQGRM